MSKSTWARNEEDISSSSLHHAKSTVLKLPAILSHPLRQLVCAAPYVRSRHWGCSRKRAASRASSAQANDNVKGAALSGEGSSQQQRHTEREGTRAPGVLCFGWLPAAPFFPACCCCGASSSSLLSPNTAATEVGFLFLLSEKFIVEQWYLIAIVCFRTDSTTCFWAASTHKNKPKLLRTYYS
eukprot:1145852-Pelagomonas_calceolata.AAC.7